MRSMKRVWQMAWFSVYRAYRNPMSFAASVLVPVAFAFVIASVFQSGTSVPSVVVVDEDQSTASAEMVAELKATPYEVRMMARREAEEAVRSKDASFAILLPAGFETSVANRRPEIGYIRANGDASLENPARRAEVIARSLAAGIPVPSAAVVIEAPLGPDAAKHFAMQRLIFGIYAMFALSVLIQRASDLGRERESGMLQRTLVSGVSFGEVVAAHALGIALSGLVQAVLILTITGSMGVPWLEAGLLAIAVPTLGMVFAAAGIAIGLSGLARSPVQVQNAGLILSIGLAMLGGAFWPLEIVPANVQEVARISPVYWSIEALRGGFVFDGWSSQALPVSILLLIGTLGMAVGVQGLRRTGR